MMDDVFGILGTVQGGSFRVEEVVAEGGFAVVYRAYHGAFRASVALKCLKVPGALSGDEQAEFLEHFRGEAELLFRLSASIPEVVRPLHVGTLNQDDGRFVPFIAIEWLEGQTLDAIVSERARRGEPPLGLGRVIELLDPVARALDRAHRFPGPSGVVSVIHRDLKPENIFVARMHGEERVKILDYGIAKAKSTATQIVGRQSATASGIAAFTPAYGAPEQWLPKRFGQTGAWTDVWGLAMTAVECLCGRAPLQGDQAALFAGAIDPERRPTPKGTGVTVPDGVEQAFRTALAVDPKDRYHDIATFWGELSAAAGYAGTKGAASASVATITTRGSGSLPPDPQARTIPGPLVEPSHEVPDLVVTSGRTPLSHRRDETAGQGHRTATEASNDGLVHRSAFELDDRIERTAPPARSMQPLDGIGLGPGPGPARPAARVGRHVLGSSAMSPLGSSSLDLKAPIQLLVLSVLLMIADFVYVSLTGQVFHLGPVRTFWIAGPLAVVGLALLVSRLLSHHD